MNRKPPEDEATAFQKQMKDFLRDNSFAVSLGLMAVVLIFVAGIVMSCRSGPEGLRSWGDFLTGSGTVLLGFAALLAGIRAVTEYKARTRTERARWRSELFASFYGARSRYRTIRRKLDFEAHDDILALIEKDRRREVAFSAEEQKLFDDFTDYLNFFEFVAHLHNEGQLNADDIRAMFEHYLRRLSTVRESKSLRRYISDNGFENLERLLVHYEKTKTASPNNGQP